MKSSILSLNPSSSITDLASQQLRVWAKESQNRSLPRSSKKRELTKKDIARLQVFKDAKDRGYDVEALLELSEERLRLLSQSHVSLAPFLEANKQRFANHIQRFFEYVDAYDEVSAERILAQQALIYQPREFVYGFVIPFISHFKARAQNKSGVSSEERLVVNVLRSLLSTLNRIHFGKKERQLTAKKLLFTTLQGHTDELEILAAAILSRGGGAQSLYFGPGLAPIEILKIHNKAQPNCIVLCREMQAEETPKDLQQFLCLRKSLPLSVQILALGSYSKQEKEILLESDIWVLFSYAELEQFLLFQGATF